MTWNPTHICVMSACLLTLPMSRRATTVTCAILFASATTQDRYACRPAWASTRATYYRKPGYPKTISTRCLPAAPHTKGAKSEMQTDTLPMLGRGFYWQELEVGQRFQTFRRTITETDIVNFINVTGMLEAIFIDTTFEHGAIKGRPVPGILTYGIIEGFIMQSMVQGTGLAMLELEKKILAPV